MTGRHLIVVRHAESLRSSGIVTRGDDRVDRLTERGIAQAKKLARRLFIVTRERRFSIFSGPATRTTQTAEVIAATGAATGAVSIDHALVEYPRVNERIDQMGATPPQRQQHEDLWEVYVQMVREWLSPRLYDFEQPVVVITHAGWLIAVQDAFVLPHGVPTAAVRVPRHCDGLVWDGHVWTFTGREG